MKLKKGTSVKHKRFGKGVVLEHITTNVLIKWDEHLTEDRKQEKSHVRVSSLDILDSDK